MAKYPKPFYVWTTYDGHGGVDYPQPAYTPIRAVANGVISFSGWWNGNAGNTRTLLTDDGVKIMHCHLVDLKGPAVGKRVKAGDVIAYVGTTGHSTGNHLHQEIWVNGVKQAGANYWKYIDKYSVISANGAGSGSGGGTDPVPDPTPQKRKKSMSTIYRKQEGSTFTYALAGESPGTSANWLETVDTDLARDWGIVHGNSVILSVSTWNGFRDRYLERLRTS